MAIPIWCGALMLTFGHGENNTCTTEGLYASSLANELASSLAYCTIFIAIFYFCDILALFCFYSFEQFACIDEFPTSERNTWKSAGEGDDKIAIPPPHMVTTYYIGVFGYYQSKFKISFKLVYA